MRITWYQGRMYVTFNYPAYGTPITTLMYPNMDVKPDKTGYHYIKWERKR